MYQIELFSGEKYDITKKEADEIAKEIGNKFVTVKRLKKILAVSSIKQIGVPDYIRAREIHGDKILFGLQRGRMVVFAISKDREVRSYSGDGWQYPQITFEEVERKCKPYEEAIEFLYPNLKYPLLK